MSIGAAALAVVGGGAWPPRPPWALMDTGTKNRSAAHGTMHFIFFHSISTGTSDTSFRRRLWLPLPAAHGAPEIRLRTDSCLEGNGAPRLRAGPPPRQHRRDKEVSVGVDPTHSRWLARKVLSSTRDRNQFRRWLA